MTSLPGGLYAVTAIIEAIAVIVSFGLLVRFGFPVTTRRHVVRLAIAWILFVTMEFWILGPYSYVFINDEGEVSVPLFLYFARHYSGGLFTHGIGGGNDAYAMFINAAQAYFSIDFALMKWFPVWIGLGLNKLIVSGVAFAGAYLLARRGGGGGRSMAAALAILHAAGHHYLVNATLTSGLGFAIIPLAIYVLVCRLPKSNYLIGAAAIAVVHAVSSTPTHSAMVLGAGVLIAWLFMGCRRPLRFSAGFGALVIAAATNWHEVLFAMVQWAPYSFRGAEGGIGFSLYGAFTEPLRFLRENLHWSALAALSLFGLWKFHRPRLLQASGMILAALFGGPLLVSIPWHATPMPYLGSFNFTYIDLSVIGLLILTSAWALRAISAENGGATLRGRPLGEWLTLFIVALAIGQAAWFKSFNAAQWLGNGGQRIYFAYENLKHRPWAPDRLFRVATIPYLMDPMTVASYGLEVIGGNLNVFPSSYGKLFFYGMPRANRNVATGYLYPAAHTPMNFLCCDAYDVEKELELDILRMINVEFVISALPLHGGGLVQVSGPTNGFVPPRRGTPMVQKIRQYLDLNFSRSQAYVYQIPGSLPRAFVATSVDQLPPEPSSPNAAYYRGIAKRALAGTALVPENRLGEFNAFPAGEVTEIAETPDGYDLRTDLPKGGVVVVATAWSPFWKARTQGIDLPVASANATHLAIAAPPGTSAIKLVFERPLLRQHLLSRGLP